jgi:sugar-specific transcriptional regulator TrmB
MTIVGEGGLKAEAECLADRLRSELRNELNELQRKLDELQRIKSEKEAEIEASHDARERVRNFTPRINNEFQCPACYVYRKLESPIRPIPQSEDVFRCVTCAMTYPPFSFGVVPPS